MKKRISLLLALALLLSLGSAALADGTGNSHNYSPNDPTTMNQTITTIIPNNKLLWHLEIPADVTITSGGYDGRQDVGNVTIVLDNPNVELTDNQKIEASLTYDGQMMGVEDGSIILNYQLSDKNVFIGGETIETLETGKAYVVGTMTKTDTRYNSPNAWVLEGDWDNAPSGNYAGTIVYSSVLVESQG